jgi:signal transduction histidine kinase
LRREIVALAAGDRDLNAVTVALEQSAAEQGVRALLLNRSSGRVVYDTNRAGGAWSGQSLDDVVRPRGEFSNLDPNLPIGRYQAPDGSRWLVFGQPLPGQGAGRLLLLVAKPEPTAFGFFRQVYLQPLCQAGLIALLLSLLLAVLIARSVARPLRGMAEASEAIAQGDYEQKLPLSGPEEVQRVAVSFNEMASQVARSQRAQRDLVANISHDLRTPLTSIRGWSQALVDGTASDDARRRQAVTVINTEAARMERMVDQLLDLARMESGQLILARQPVDLGQLLGEVAESFALRAQEQGVDLTLERQPVPTILGDPDRLTQILANLLDNALDHTPRGGRVRLALYLLSDGQVEIIVQDNGRGIPQEELGRIFERFYQVDKSRAGPAAERGSGLGLAIVRELVAAHGGQITARSALGQDTVFAIRLPAMEPTSQ